MASGYPALFICSTGSMLIAPDSEADASFQEEESGESADHELLGGPEIDVRFAMDRGSGCLTTPSPQKNGRITTQNFWQIMMSAQGRQ